jgi:outer membrane protein assembly factor BamB
MVTSRGLGGEERWSRPVGELAGPVTVDDLVVLGATRGPAELFLLDRLTGQELWRQSLPGEVCSAPIMDRGVIYLGTTAGFEARELASGARLEGWPVAPPVSAEVAMTASQFIYISVDGKLVIFDREKGTVARELTGATPGVPPLLDRNAVYYFGKDGLMRLSLDSDKAEPVQWMDTSWLGKVTAAAVVEDGNVYIGMAGWGLVRLGKGRGN